jgi:[ribosomal protein S18]-alanine N-acetyltransferase
VAAVVLSQPALRPMTHADLAEVARIEASAYEFPWSRGIFRSCLEHGHKCWVLDRQGLLLGYAILSVGAEEAHILNLCVAPAHQGHGHGGHLLRRLLDVARWHRARRVYLEVRPSNELARAMYERAGFNEVGRRPGYYPARNGREDAIVMAMELLPPDRG